MAFIPRINFKLKGDATATTASAGDNDTSVATTAFVQTEIQAHNAKMSGPQPSDATATHNAWTQVDQSTEVIDDGGLADGTNDRITIQRTGTYLVGGRTRFRTDTQGHQIGVRIMNNGTTEIISTRTWEEPSNSYGDHWTAEATTIVALTSGDDLTLEAWNYGATAGNATLSQGKSELWALEIK